MCTTISIQNLADMRENAIKRVQWAIDDRAKFVAIQAQNCYYGYRSLEWHDSTVEIRQKVVTRLTNVLKTKVAAL